MLVYGGYSLGTARYLMVIDDAYFEVYMWSPPSDEGLNSTAGWELNPPPVVQQDFRAD